MPTPFLSPEEYDERAHRLYDDGDYDGALETLKEALRLYPHSVDLYVGLGYTRMAREEYVWAKQAFERALVLDPEHEDALVGMGEMQLRFGQRAEALQLFRRARETACGDDSELLLTIGRALYRDALYEQAHEVLARAAELHPESAESAAALGYTLHRLRDETGARRQLLRALQLDAEYHEARIYLGHLLYDKAEWAAAARAFERVPPAEHWDTLGVWRLIELKRGLQKLEPGAPELGVWERRLAELEAAQHDPLEELLAELASTAEPASAAAGRPASRSSARVAAGSGAHRVQLPDGVVAVGTWEDIVEQLRQARAPRETVAQFMRRLAQEAQAEVGVHVPAEDPRGFVLAGAQAGFWQIEY